MSSHWTAKFVVTATALVTATSAATLTIVRASPAQQTQAPVNALTGHTRKVRPTGLRAERLFDEALSQSAIVSGLVALLDRTDVIVVVQVSGLEPSAFGGRTSLMAAPKGTRYVRVIITDTVAPTRAIELLGHELQHVVEIAAEPSIRTEPDLRNHYKRIGFELADNRFETAQAQLVEQAVRLELADRIRQPRTVR